MSTDNTCSTLPIYAQGVIGTVVDGTKVGAVFFEAHIVGFVLKGSNSEIMKIDILV